jgi:hypothetical protein
VVATVLWAVVSLVGVAVLADLAWSALSSGMGSIPDLVSGPMPPALPDPPAEGMDTPAPIPAVDPRPAAAAAWNASTVAYGKADYATSCRGYAFGASYIYANRFSCTSDLRGYADKEGVHDRTLEGQSRIDPEHMVLLADGSVAFVNTDVTWSAGPPDGWDPAADGSVQVLHEFPGHGWLQVGYLSDGGDLQGYVPQPLPPSLTVPDAGTDPNATETPSPDPAPSPSPTPSPTRRAGSPSPGDVVPVTGTDPRPAAAAAWNASLAGWTADQTVTLCRAYAVGSPYLYATAKACDVDQRWLLGHATPEVRQELAAARIVPSRMVVLRDHSVAFVTPNGLVMVMRQVPGQGWRVVGTQTPGGFVVGTVPQPLSSSLTAPAPAGGTP